MIAFVKENAALLVDALQIVTDGMNIWSVLLGIAAYVLFALGLYALAKHRAIDRPWLAWLPIGNLWILGCLADQYRKIVLGKEKTNSKDRLFWINVVAAGLLIAIIVLVAVGLSYITENAPIMSVSSDVLKELEGLSGDKLSEGYLRLMAEMISTDEDLARTVNIGLIGFSILAIMLTVAVVNLAVEKYKALYFLYASCLPKHAVWFLVVSIVLGVEAVFVFVCRKQNQGMPHDKKGRIQVI